MTTEKLSNKMEACKECIRKHLERRKIRKDKDVTQLYLANNDLEEACDLSRFKMLKYLWLNGNLLKQADFLTLNYRIAELYLENNNIVSIAGALGHLTSLQVLLLQRNQLRKLEETVKEFRAMQALKTLNLFSNPISQETEYRYYVIHYVPSVTLLDRQEVIKDEKDKAIATFDQETHRLRATIAFGRRARGAPIKRSHSAEDSDEADDQEDLGHTRTQYMREVANNFRTPPAQNLESAITERIMKRSVMQYSSLDWFQVPTSEECRLRDEASPKALPQILTIKFR